MSRNAILSFPILLRFRRRISPSRDFGRGAALVIAAVVEELDAAADINTVLRGVWFGRFAGTRFNIGASAAFKFGASRKPVELDVLGGKVGVASPQILSRQINDLKDHLNDPHFREGLLPLQLEAQHVDHVPSVLEAVAGRGPDAGQPHESLLRRRVRIGRSCCPPGVVFVGGAQLPVQRHDEDLAAVIAHAVEKGYQVCAVPRVGSDPPLGVGHIGLNYRRLGHVELPVTAHYHSGVAVQDLGEHACHEIVGGAHEQQNIPSFQLIVDP